MISIIDYDIGNIGAVVNMLRHLGVKCNVTSNSQEIEQATGIILPGNGSFDACVRNLRATKLVPVLDYMAKEKAVPILGICVGAQMLGNGSAEGVEPGLGWIDMRVERLPANCGQRIPHMGWNELKVCNLQHPIAQGLDLEPRFYFVHSYYMVPRNEGYKLFTTCYGIEFTSGVAVSNIVGVQFHPEKSHRYGKKLLKAFAKWTQ
jgi:glutamine amidotransferase